MASFRLLLAVPRPACLVKGTPIALFPARFVHVARPAVLSNLQKMEPKSDQDAQLQTSFKEKGKKAV